MSSGVFEPAELADMRDVFDEITSQHCFSRDPHARTAFAKYLLDAYPGGTFNLARDKPVLESTARAYYGRDAE